MCGKNLLAIAAYKTVQKENLSVTTLLVCLVWKKIMEPGHIGCTITAKSVIVHIIKSQILRIE